MSEFVRPAVLGFAAGCLLVGISTLGLWLSDTVGPFAAGVWWLSVGAASLWAGLRGWRT